MPILMSDLAARASIEEAMRQTPVPCRDTRYARPPDTALPVASPGTIIERPQSLHRSRQFPFKLKKTTRYAFLARTSELIHNLDRFQSGGNMKIRDTATCLLSIAMLVAMTGCATIRAMGNTEDGAGAEAMTVWDRWVDSGGDIAAATTWERKVQDGVTIADVEAAFDSVAAEDNIKAVGEMRLSEELEARTGEKQKFLKIYSYCSPPIARAMVDFSPHMAAYLPCRIALLEKEDGLWIYTLNMDMMIRMGRKLPPALREDALKVRATIWKMLERGSRGEF
jgi:uncharacterized protein (DUF302 family)